MQDKKLQLISGDLIKAAGKFSVQLFPGTGYGEPVPQLRMEKDLFFNGEKIPACKYSIWTYPTETTWHLFINKKADVWGIEYAASADLSKIPLTVEKTISSVEVFKISLTSISATTLRLQIAWDDRKAWVDLDSE